MRLERPTVFFSLLSAVGKKPLSLPKRCQDVVSVCCIHVDILFFFFYAGERFDEYESTCLNKHVNNMIPFPHTHILRQLIYSVSIDLG